MTCTRLGLAVAFAVQLGLLSIAQAQSASSVATLPLASPEDVGMSSDRLARVSTAMQGYVDRHEVAGVVSLVARHGKIVHFESFGMRDVENGVPMTKDAIFRIASMTKPIASVALMMLWEEGAFQLKDPISEWLPEFADMQIAEPTGGEGDPPFTTVPARRPITFQHIFTHTAGLPNTYMGVTRDVYDEMRQSLPADRTAGDMVTALAALPLNYEPGTKWEYGVATDVVGLLVEVISGQTFDVFLQERIFEPLGMRDTHFYFDPEKLDRFSALYNPDDDGKIQLTSAPSPDSRWARPHRYFSGAGGLVSTASDYFTFLQMMLNGGELNGVRLLGPRTVAFMATNHIGDLETWLRGPGYGFGLGFSVVTDVGKTGMPASLGSYAWGGAFGTVFWVDPEEEILGIMMTQIRPYTHLNIRQDIQTLTYQAIMH